ncbi:hypothetical protein COCSUDRAFT_28869, partial [Coccomyxa subellipsoidea C-169]
MAISCTCGPQSLRNTEFLRPLSSSFLKSSGSHSRFVSLPNRRCRHPVGVQSSLHGFEGPLLHAAEAMSGAAA